ncbi:hypothetical protein [Paracoccus sp. Z118]|uniref:hypothetical protein n=1 Tax=Paracoccus sp. Z118 TaxID=2851017 RepID=UPI0035304B9A
MIGTPIGENAFTGVAGGLAADGRVIPVLELMYPDFMWVAADQLFNKIGKARHMFGVVRRERDGTLSGDLLDGRGSVAGRIAAGESIARRRLCLVVAGGAASAIAFAMAEKASGT